MARGQSSGSVLDHGKANILWLMRMNAVVATVAVEAGTGLQAPSVVILAQRVLVEKAQ